MCWIGSGIRTPLCFEPSCATSWTGRPRLHYAIPVLPGPDSNGGFTTAFLPSGNNISRLYSPAVLDPLSLSFMSALNRTRSMRLPSFAAPRTLGLAHSHSAGTLAALSSSCEGASLVQAARKGPSEKDKFASLGRGSSLRRRTSNPCEHHTVVSIHILLIPAISLLHPSIVWMRYSC